MRDELADFGMPFTLFKGPAAFLSDMKNDAACSLCQARRRLVFALSQNDHILEPCGRCGASVALRLGWPDENPEPSVCERCSFHCDWPTGRPRDTLAVCYECLRGGRAGIAHETEVGDVDLGHALHGLTSGASEEIARREGLETTVLKTYDDGSQSIGMRIPRDLLLEMVRTPRHEALQREYWPYHCKGFMAFLGRWGQEDFENQSPGSGREWFGEHMSADDPWEEMWEWLVGDVGWSYVYQCQSCGRHRVYVDSD